MESSALDYLDHAIQQASDTTDGVCVRVLPGGLRLRVKVQGRRVVRLYLDYGLGFEEALTSEVMRALEDAL